MEHFSHITPLLQTLNMGKTIEFYTSILDFRLAASWPNVNPVWCLLQRDNARVMFMSSEHVEQPRLSGTLYIQTTDVRAFTGESRGRSRSGGGRRSTNTACTSSRSRTAMATRSASASRSTLTPGACWGVSGWFVIVRRGLTLPSRLLNEASKGRSLFAHAGPAVPFCTGDRSGSPSIS